MKLSQKIIFTAEAASLLCSGAHILQCMLRSGARRTTVSVSPK